MLGGLCVLVGDGDCGGQLTQQVEALLRGGAQTIVYRGSGAQKDVARELRDLCRAASARLVLENVALAKELDADGAYLEEGTKKADIAAARAALGDGKSMGLAVRNAEQAQSACEAGASFLTVGAIFPEAGIQHGEIAGLRTLEHIRRTVDVPLCVFGGITRDNAPQALAAGANALAVPIALLNDANPAMAAREFTLLFNSLKPYPRGRMLTIAGSDSGGGAGIQADLKVSTLLGSFGMSAITALTAQNTLGVSGIHAAPVDFIQAQIEAVLSDIGADVIKIGMLFSPEIIRLVAGILRQHTIPAVIDPVMIAKGGAALLRQEAVTALRDELLPLAYLITPNIPEAETLTGMNICTEEDMERAAEKIQELGARNVLVKGGHLEGESVDILRAGARVHRLPGKRIDTQHTHGTGCTSSAAIATFLAQGVPLVKAVEQGKAFILEAIRQAPGLGHGHGPVNHFQAAMRALGLNPGKPNLKDIG